MTFDLLPETGIVPHPITPGMGETIGNVARVERVDITLNDLPIDIRSAGAVGDDMTDCTAAILAATLVGGGNLWIPKGVFRVDEFVIDGLTDFIIDGVGTISCVDPLQPVALIKNAARFEVRGGVTFTHADISGGRTNTGHGLHLQDCDDFRVQHHSKGTTAAGVYVAGCSGGTLLGGLSESTLADGIHITGASTDIRVHGNLSRDTGDDGIAVVSYQSDGDRCARINIDGNVVLRGHTRGVTCVGGIDVNIHGNIVDSTNVAGIYVAQETSFGTYGVDQVNVTGNTIRNANTYNTPTVDHPAILVVGGDVAFPVRDVLVEGNNIVGSGTLDIRVINDSGAGFGVYSVDVIGNHCTLNGVRVASPSIQYTGATGVFFGSIKANTVTQSTLGGIEVPNTCKYITVRDNDIVDCNTTSSGAAWGVDNQSVGGVTGPNTVVDEASTLTGQFSRGQTVLTGAKAGNTALASVTAYLAATNQATDSTT